MADKEINDLTSGGKVQAGDKAHIVRSGNSRQVDLEAQLPATRASASGPASMEFAEDTDNGSNKVTVQAPASLAADITVTLPNSTGTLRLDGRPGYRTISGADTVVSTDNGRLIIATSGTFTLALTAAATLGQYFACDVLNAGTGIVTLDANSSETINGATTQLLFPGDSAELVCTGSAWYAVIRRAAAIVTPWVSYSPTFTGFGTVSAASIWSRRLGDSLHIRGKFTTGTTTGVEAQMTLGFNGTNANVNSDATKVASIQQAGVMIRGAAGAQTYFTLIESNVGYLTFGLQGGASTALTKGAGSGIFGAGEVLTLQAEVPISGW